MRLPSQGQLLTETIDGITYTYTYDTYGNLRSKAQDTGGTSDPDPTPTPTPTPEPDPDPNPNNLLENGGFESISGWSAVYERGKSASTSSTTAHTGSKSWMLDYYTGAPAEVYREVSVTEGMTYELSGYIKGKAKLFIRTGNQTVYSEADGSSSWTLRKVSLTIPSGVTEVEVGGYLDYDDQSYLDDLNFHLLNETSTVSATSQEDDWIIIVSPPDEYTYGDGQWLDLLTAYNGNTITYDAIGNPTEWYDGTEFTWVNGRRLARAMNNSEGLTAFYTYDADGLRLSKIVNGVEHMYIWQGDKLVSEYYDGKELEFFYDESGAPYAFSYRSSANASPVTYYYLTNLQGDIVGILNASGNTVAKYTYNAWGEIISAAGTMAEINPLRYRGYYYDSETGFYYCKSRYYDPEICRFISADSNFSTGQGITGNNVFVYCGNNPVSRSDDEGEFWNIVVGAVVGGVMGAVATAIDSYSTSGTVDWGNVLISATVGAINGGVAATGLGVFAQAGISAVSSGLGTLVTEVNNRVKSHGWNSFDLKTVGNIAGKTLLSSAIGFGSSIIGSGAGKVVTNKLESQGTEILKRGIYRVNCYSRNQAKTFVNEGKRIINTARGISSVIGTVFTWPIATSISLSI